MLVQPCPGMLPYQLWFSFLRSPHGLKRLLELQPSCLRSRPQEGSVLESLTCYYCSLVGQNLAPWSHLAAEV